MPLCLLSQLAIELASDVKAEGVSTAGICICDQAATYWPGVRHNPRSPTTYNRRTIISKLEFLPVICNYFSFVNKPRPKNGDR